MDFTYFPSGPQQGQYPFYGVPNQQQPGVSAPNGQFQQNTQQAGQFESFSQYHPQAFDCDQAPVHPTQPAHHHLPTDLHGVGSYTNGLIEPSNHELTNGKSLSAGLQTALQESGQSDDTQADRSNNRSSSEEKDNLTPAQSRRKEQNRAAQRAFRERKERRVKDLEQELTEYKQNISSLLEDNETLKRQMAKVSTENEILRATSNISRQNGHNNGSHHDVEEHHTTGPMRYLPLDFPLGPPQGHINGKGGVAKENQPIIAPHRVKVNEETGERLLDAAATWDLIVSHLSDCGTQIDVQDIYNRLKGHAMCDGTGPVLEEAVVKKAIQDSIAENKDELI